jgi:serine/threonine-protein kinase
MVSMHSSGARLQALRDLLPGQVFQGTQGTRYYLRERIGEGGQGWVFAANWNEPEGYRVIFKVLRPDAVNPETLARFEREASVLRMLGQAGRPNPHIVRFFDHARQRVAVPGGNEAIDVSFTVLEYVAGPTLERVLGQSRGAGLMIDRSRRIGGQIAFALEDVHANKVVHRDLKPSNVLLASEGGLETAKVTDFGLVKVVDFGLARTMALAGASLGYAPPEQFERGNQRVSARTDVFSFATILYEMLTGVRAFPYGEGENALVIVTRLLNGPRPSLARTRGSLPPPLAARPDLVESLDAALAQAMAAEPADRQPSVQAFWGSVEGVLRSAGEQSAEPPIPVRFSPAPSAVMPGPYDSEPPDPLGRTARQSSAPRDDLRIANPASWRWHLRVPAVGAGAVRAAAFDPQGEQAYAAGNAGLMRWGGARAWARLSAPVLDGSRVRGVAWFRPGELFVFGARGLVARCADGGAAEPLNVPEPDATFHGAHCDDRGVLTLVGERPAASGLRGGVQTWTMGTVAQFSQGRLTLLSDAPTCSGLRGVTRLRGGSLVACGDWGAIVRLEFGVAGLVASICAGHLNAIGPLPDGGALTVGAGGHALSLSARLEPQLEAVQTTRDLLALAIDGNGVAWAGSAQARLLRRVGGSWLRMSGELGLSSSIVAIWAGSRNVRAICEDGAVVEGVVDEG